MVRELGIGGTERQTTATALALDRRIFEPHIVACRARGFRAEELRQAGIPVFQIPVSSLRGPSAIKSAFILGRYIRRHGIDIVHTFDTPMNLFGTLVARCFRTPVVLSSQRAYRDLMSPWGRRLLRLVDRLVDGVVVNCLAVRRHMEDDEHNPPSHTLLCYNGIDTRIFCPGDSRRPAVLEPAGLAIGVVCGLRPEKDLETLVRAFHAVRRTRPDAQLVVVGSGPSLEGLQRLARDLDVAGACHFEPATSDVTRWLRAVVWLAAVGTLRLNRSHLGLALKAIREDEIAAAAMGVNVRRTKLLAFVISAVLAGVSGVFFANMAGYLNPDSFTLTESCTYLLMVVLGGMSNVAGGIVSAFAVTSLPEALRVLARSRLVVYSIILLLMLRYTKELELENLKRLWRRFRPAPTSVTAPDTTSAPPQ